MAFFIESETFHKIYGTTKLSLRIIAVQLTILLKSTIYTSLLLLYSGYCPPNSTARWSSIMVREKPEQGGGLVPLSWGEDHVPEREREQDIAVLKCTLHVIAGF